MVAGARNGTLPVIAQDATDVTEKDLVRSDPLLSCKCQGPRQVPGFKQPET
jgi:hypothetical protein